MLCMFSSRDSRGVLEYHCRLLMRAQTHTRVVRVPSRLSGGSPSHLVFKPHWVGSDTVFLISTSTRIRATSRSRPLCFTRQHACVDSRRCRPCVEEFALLLTSAVGLLMLQLIKGQPAYIVPRCVGWQAIACAIGCPLRSSRM